MAKKTAQKKTTLPLDPRWRVVEKIALALISKGVIVPCGILAVIIIPLIRLPKTELAYVFRSVLDGLVSFRLLGWFLACAISVTWAVCARRCRKMNEAEVKRMGMEKSKLQQAALGADAPSSQPPPSS